MSSVISCQLIDLNQNKIVCILLICYPVIINGNFQSTDCATVIWSSPVSSIQRDRCAPEFSKNKQ